MMNEFCIDTDVGELRPLSSEELPPAIVAAAAEIVAPIFLVGDFPSAEVPWGEVPPGIMTDFLVGDIPFL